MIAVSGAAGQIGSELTEALCTQYPPSNIVAFYNRSLPPQHLLALGITPCQVDISNGAALRAAVQTYNIQVFYHLAAVLSGSGESDPTTCWQVNTVGFMTVLELAREGLLKRIFFASSIAVFGPSAPKDDCPQNVILDPSSVYGVSKVSGELLAQYYYRTHNVDVRSVRYVGVLTPKTVPSGGTSDYAIEMCLWAKDPERRRRGPYPCYLKPDTKLPWVSMPDAVAATIQLMKASPDKVPVRTSYNLSAISLSPKDLEIALQKVFPDFTVEYVG
eukprot:PhF_6_TR6132/c0_g1_i2/m.9091